MANIVYYIVYMYIVYCIQYVYCIYFVKLLCNMVIIVVSFAAFSFPIISAQNFVRF